MRFCHWSTYYMEIGGRFELSNYRFELRVSLLYWHFAICWR